MTDAPPGSTTGDDTLVSVVVPTYGRDPAALRRSVASVAGQTHDATELVVVDDSAPEEDLRSTALEGVGWEPFARLQWLTGGDHGGAGAARNTGIRAARGDYIAFLDDDDTWAATKLERQLGVFDRAEGVGLVYCPQRYVDGSGTEVGTGRVGARGDALEALLSGRQLAPFSSVVVRSAVPETVGYIDERLPVLEDKDWYLRIAREYRVGAVEEPLVRRRVGGGDHLSQDWEGMSERTYPLFMAKHRPLAAEHGALCERRFVSWLAKTTAATGIGTGHRRAAWPYLFRALRAYPLDPELYAYLALTVSGRRTRRALRTVERAIERLRGVP